MSQEEVQPILGRKRENVKTREISGDDPFKDAPFYAAPSEGEQSEHINEVPVGGTICGIFKRLVESRKANTSGSKSWYLCMEVDQGGETLEKIRLMTPTQLRNVLQAEKVEPGTYLELTYVGRKTPADGGKKYHLWNVKIGETEH